MSRRDQFRLGLVLDQDYPGQRRADQNHRGRDDSGIRHDTDDKIARNPKPVIKQRKASIAADIPQNLNEDDCGQKG
jgi:hypothetical protein